MTTHRFDAFPLFRPQSELLLHTPSEPDTCFLGFFGFGVSSLAAGNDTVDNDTEGSVKEDVGLSSEASIDDVVSGMVEGHVDCSEQVEGHGAMGVPIALVVSSTEVEDCIILSDIVEPAACDGPSSYGQ